LIKSQFTADSAHGAIRFPFFVGFFEVFGPWSFTSLVGFRCALPNLQDLSYPLRSPASLLGFASLYPTYRIFLSPPLSGLSLNPTPHV
jgi:hypothetical protein